jgi:hypothetical protein
VGVFCIASSKNTIKTVVFITFNSSMVKIMDEKVKAKKYRK